jgi:hypothetical protein
MIFLCSKNANSTNILDLLLGLLSEESGLDNYGSLGQYSASQNLVDSVSGDVNHGDFVRLSRRLDQFISVFLAQQSPDLVNVDSRAESVRAGLVEESVTELSKVSRVISVHVGSVVQETSGITTSTRVLSVLSDTSVSGANMSSLLSVLSESSSL